MHAMCAMQLIILSCICGYHAYKEIRKAVYGEQFFRRQWTDMRWQRRIIDLVLLWDTYVSQKISSMFVMGGGTIKISRYQGSW